MVRWLRWGATAALIATAAVATTVAAPLLADVARHALVALSAAGIAALWGVLVGVAVAPIAAVLVIGVPLGASDLAALGADTAAVVLALGCLTLPVFVGTVASLGRQLQRQRALAGRAQLDPLTGLLNRVSVEARLASLIKGARERRSGPMFAVLFLDLDRFKVVNDTFGHDVGDRLLCAIADLLRDNVRGDDLVARLGGDEFVVVLPGLKDRRVAAAVAAKLVGLLALPIDVGAGRQVSVSASIGVALYPNDGEDVSTLLTSADTAMYTVKTSGKNSYVFSDVRQRDQQARRRELELRLRQALIDHRLRVAYQPQVDLRSDRLIGFEALLRWDDHVLGSVSPAEFVPVAEESGLIVPIGEWLLREACFQLRTWDHDGAPPVSVAVNASTLQFRQEQFIEQVALALRDSGLAADRLEIEVTESVLIDQFDVAVQALRRLHRLGVRTALDDFGTGYSSLSYLQRLPIEVLKIDRAFVTNLSTPASDTTCAPIVDAIAAMGRALGKTVVAEGVETAAQAHYLRQIGVERAQGFHYGRALNALDATRAIARQRARDRLAERDARRHERARAVGRLGGEHVELLFD